MVTNTVMAMVMAMATAKATVADTTWKSKTQDYSKGGEKFPLSRETKWSVGEGRGEAKVARNSPSPTEQSGA